VLIGVDDAGSGFSSMSHIVNMEADVIKVDISLVRDIHLNKMRRAMVGALAEFARQAEALVIAEGVELEEERATLITLGVTAAQGYLFGRPAALRLCHPVPRGAAGGGGSLCLSGTGDGEENGGRAPSFSAAPVREVRWQSDTLRDDHIEPFAASARSRGSTYPEVMLLGGGMVANRQGFVAAIRYGAERNFGCIPEPVP
jgi:hypothetical protein